MPRAWRYLQTLPDDEFEARAIDFHNGLTLQDVKELPRCRMKMPGLAVPGRHALLNYAEISTVEQVPPFAPRTPLISLARCDVDGSQQDAPEYAG